MLSKKITFKMLGFVLMYFVHEQAIQASKSKSKVLILPKECLMRAITLEEEEKILNWLKEEEKYKNTLMQQNSLENHQNEEKFPSFSAKKITTVCASFDSFNKK